MRSCALAALATLGCGSPPAEAPAPARPPPAVAVPSAGQRVSDPEPPPQAKRDDRAELARLAHELSTATGERATVLGRRLALEDPEAFFTRVFGEELGRALAADYLPPIALYTINIVEPGKEVGSSLWSFARVDGVFRYLGKMKPVKPDATEYDELSVRHLREALEGR